MDRRKFLATTAAATAAVAAKAASAASVTPFGQTAAPTMQTPLPLGPLPGARYPDARLESMKKSGATFGPSGFPAFAGTMAVERVATGFRWAEGPVYFAAGRYVLFSDIPNNRIMRFCEDDGRVSVYRQPSMNSNGNTIDREGAPADLRAQRPAGHPDRTRRLDHDHRRHSTMARGSTRRMMWSPRPMARSGSAIRPTASAAFMRASKPTRSRTSTMSTGWTRKRGTSRWSSTTSCSPTACASRLTRRSCTSVTPALPTRRRTRRISACSTSISRPASCRTAKSSRTCPSPASATDSLRQGWECLVLGRLG